MPVIVPELKIAYFALPKAASTSVKLALWHAVTGSPWSGTHEEIHAQYRIYPLKPDDMDGLDDYFKFTVIRDPIDRLLSAYHNRVWQHHDLEIRRPKSLLRKLDWRLRFPWFQPYPEPDYFFNHLDGYQERSYSVWHHTISATRFIGSDLDWFDNVYRIEDLGWLEAELKNRSGHDVPLRERQNSGQGLSFSALKADTRDFLLRYTASDYALLGGNYTPLALTG